MKEKAATIWGTASRAHINRDFTFGSQALAVAFTERESIGGRVWPNVIFGDTRYDYAFAVWGNSTLGLLSYWWHSSRQQSSKASLTIRQAETIPVLDLRTLSDEQLTTAEGIFDEFRELELMPAYLADADPNRALLDRGWCASCWGWVRMRTGARGGWPPSGASSPPSKGARPDPRARCTWSEIYDSRQV